MKRLSIAFLLAAAAFYAATPARAQTSTAAQKPAAHRAVRRTVAHSLYRPATLHDRAPAVYKARFTTTRGVFVVQVTRDWSPVGADRFYNLVKYGFFTNASFFRVLPGFVAQFGINARPAISRVWSHATIPDDPVKQSNRRGTLSFATAGPNTRTTQIFINLADNPSLDSRGFSPFGEVIEGMDVVDKFYSGYGEGAPQGNGPDQDKIQSAGKVYLDHEFPQLDSIKSAVIVLPAPVVHHPAAAAKKKPAAHTAQH